MNPRNEATKMALHTTGNTAVICNHPHHLKTRYLNGTGSLAGLVRVSGLDTTWWASLQQSLTVAGPTVVHADIPIVLLLGLYLFCCKVTNILHIWILQWFA